MLATSADSVQDIVPYFLPDVLPILHIHVFNKTPQGNEKQKRKCAFNFNYQFKNAVLYPECFTNRILWVLISEMVKKYKHIQELENIPDTQSHFKRKNSSILHRIIVLLK